MLMRECIDFREGIACPICVPHSQEWREQREAAKVQKKVGTPFLFLMILAHMCMMHDL